MRLDQLATIEGVQQCLAGAQAVAFSIATRQQERYLWVQKTPGQTHYKASIGA